MNESRPFIAVICGLRSEAQVVAQSVGEAHLCVGISGANAQRAETIAKKFAAEGARAIVSVGVSGGLDPSLEPGDLIFGDMVIAGDEARYEADKNLLNAIKQWDEESQKVKKSSTGGLFGSDEIIDSADKKAALFRQHGVIAVDMESHGAARAAKAAGIPFLAVRSIADPASRAMPSAALNAVAPDGSTRVIKTLGAAFRDPQQFPELLKLGADSSAALKSLRRSLSPIFGRLFLSLNL